MMKVFETFKPKSSLLQKYISYYYVDVADNENYVNEYICYPHFNNTISLYRSHTGNFTAGHSIISFKHDATPLQVFTPLRESILKVTQNGPIHKIGIVFRPFGINQFLANRIPINELISSPSFRFFQDDFILSLFEKFSIEQVTLALDEALLNLLVPIHNICIERTILLLETVESEMTVEELAVKIGISRKHLSRLFKKNIGISIQKYRSIVRFRQLMDGKLFKYTHESLTTLSHRSHYADQSHFIRECKLLTGLIPSRFFKEGKILGTEDTFWKLIK